MSLLIVKTIFIDMVSPSIIRKTLEGWKIQHQPKGISGLPKKGTMSLHSKLFISKYSTNVQISL